MSREMGREPGGRSGERGGIGEKTLVFFGIVP